MISKQTTFKIESFEILDISMMKLASFDLPNDEAYDSDFLYIKVRAVSAGEYYGDNKNGDWFAEDELKRCFTTFLTAHVFKNHENKDAANAIGEVLSSVWDDAMKCVVLILKIDRKIAPTIVRSIEKGYMTDVSMGCRVPYSICSICGNKARNAKEYCDHIRLYRRRIFPDGRKAYEINVNPKFHDISVVLNGAEKVAKVTDIYDAEAAKKKEPKKVSSIKKVASVIEESFDGAMEKVASYNDIIADAFEMPTTDCMQKHADEEKRADFHKRVEGIVLNAARHSMLEDKRGFESARLLLKSAFTKYWSARDLDLIALKLKALAVQSKKSLNSVFASFLTVLDFAGIELSPAELCGLIERLFKTSCLTAGLERPSLDQVTRIERHVEENPFRKFSLSQAIPVLNDISSQPSVARIRIIKAVKPVDAPSDSLNESIMSNIVRSLIPLRSMHPAPLIKRIRIIKAPFNNAGQFDVTQRGKDLYSMYQGDRMRRLMSGVLSNGIAKFASEWEEGPDTFEKTAKYTRMKATYIGTPVIYAYSKLQRSRIEDDKDVSTANKFIAQYPEAVAGMNILFGPEVYKRGKKAIQNMSGKSKDIVGKLKKNASAQDDILYMYENGFDKEADSVLDSFGLSKDDLELLLNERAMLKKASVESDVEKVAQSIESGNFDYSSQADFNEIMAIASIIRSKF